MKICFTRLTVGVLAGVFALAGMVWMTGCAEMDASNQESLLSAAGFATRVPETPKQKELYAAAPSYKVERFEAKGKVFYGYKDEKKGVAYVGDEAAYQRYKELAVKQNIAQQNYAAAQMNQQMSYDWYGAYYAPMVMAPRVGVGRR